VAQMAAVIDGHSAHVHTDFSGFNALKWGAAAR